MNQQNFGLGQWMWGETDIEKGFKTRHPGVGQGQGLFLGFRCCNVEIGNTG